LIYNEAEKNVPDDRHNHGNIGDHHFYCSFLLDDLDWAYHGYVCMAEGLTEMGIACYGNKNMYKQGVDREYLIQSKENVSLHDVDIVFFHSALYITGRRQADEIIMNITNTPNRKFVTVFMDESDGVRTPGFCKGARSCDIVLKCNYNRKYHYPDNFYPWQFGVSNRMLNSVYPKPFNERENSILVNFRVKHQLRDYINKLIFPDVTRYLHWDNGVDMTSDSLTGNDLLFWKQTRGRHYPNYYDKLSTSKMCACYGGVFSIPWGNHDKYTARIARGINDIIKLSQWDRVRQWDSWRLWEAWTAGCCVIHVDFEKYGCVLPVMPQNGEHYIGIDIQSPQKIESLLKDKSRLESIAENGRNFVLMHYTPRAVAEYLLNQIIKW
jgi:hypothetical protein